ncbi:MAG: ABC transporter substrate-binding protein [Planctomycetota bacterium]
MPNRFGLKDLLIVALLVAVLVSVWLAMKQFDRQWDRMSALETQTQQLVSEQSAMRRDVSELLDKLETGGLHLSGGGGGRNTGSSNAALGGLEESYDPHARLDAARADPEFAEGDRVIDAFGTNVGRITPLVTSDAYGRRIQIYVLEGLTTTDPQTLETVPLLARSWTIEDNTEAWRRHVDAEMARPLTEAEVRDEPLFPMDGTADEQAAYVAERLAEGRREGDVVSDPDAPPATWITFTLRRGPVFSDGEPVTAEDVKFTFDLLQNPAVNAPALRQFFDNLKACEILDERTVRFAIKRPHYEALGHAGGRAVLPKHFYERFTPEQINQDTGLLLGSGPYRMRDPEAWRPGQPLELVRNERYWGTKPAFDRIAFREISNDVARLTAFRNGEIDFFAAQPEQYEQLLQDEELVARSQHYAYDTVPTGYNFIAWNQRRDGQPTRFADVRVRQAMTFLTPREQIAADLYLGYAKPAAGPFAPGSPQFDPSLSARPFDVTRGQTLLAEAGWSDPDGNGVLDHPEHGEFRIKLTYPSGNELGDKIVLYLKDAYARAGIVLEPDPLEFSILIERLDDQAFDAITLGWGGGAVERDLRQTFHSVQAKKGGDNFMSYVNPELDVLIDQARMTLDGDARMELWRAAHRIIYDEQPYTFLFNRQTLRFLDGRFRNVGLVTSGLNDRTEWFVPMSLQRWTD